MRANALSVGGWRPLYDAVAAFVQSKNSKSFIDTLQNSNLRTRRIVC